MSEQETPEPGRDDPTPEPSPEPAPEPSPEPLPGPNDDDQGGQEGK